MKIIQTMILAIMLAMTNPAKADLGTAIVGSLFGGKSVSKNLNEEKKAVADSARDADSDLFDHFYAVSNDGLESAPIELTGVGFQPYLVQKNRVLFIQEGIVGHSIQDIDAKLSDYTSVIGSDAISMRYVAFAKSRGNHVSLYKHAVGFKIKRSTGWQYPQQWNWNGVERCMIEFNQNNEVVSMLGRFHQFENQTVGVSKKVITEIIFGKATTTRFQDGLKAGDILDGLIRQL